MPETTSYNWRMGSPKCLRIWLPSIKHLHSDHWKLDWQKPKTQTTQIITSRLGHVTMEVGCKNGQLTTQKGVVIQLTSGSTGNSSTSGTSSTAARKKLWLKKWLNKVVFLLFLILNLKIKIMILLWINCKLWLSAANTLNK